MTRYFANAALSEAAFMTGLERNADVRIDFNGLKKMQLVSGTCTYLQSDDWRAKNTLEEEVLVPRVRPVQVGAQSVDLQVQSRSFEVYRLQTGRK